MTTRSRLLTLLVVMLCAALVLPGAAYAQREGGGGGDRPSPGGSGGNIGGPGMSGGAQNAGRSAPEFSMPGVSVQEISAPDINAPEGGGFGGNQGSAGANQQGGGRLGNRQGGGVQGDFNGGGSGGNLTGNLGGIQISIGDTNGDGAPDTRTFGGFAPFGGDERGSLAARFGERGTSSLPISSIQETLEGIGSWRSEQARGGFGAQSEGGFFSALDNVAGTPWHPEGETDVPAAPAALEDVDWQAAQTTAQAAVSSAYAEASEQAEQWADEATDAAQDAYDQLWEDYYDAVDYTADAYYDTVTATYDYMLATYEEAVDYTAATVDYYLDYALQYASYCALYPWDCYSYAYDVATSTYVYVGTVSDTPVTTVQIGDVTVNATLPVQAAPAPLAEAYEAIVVFANDQLGAVVEPMYAGVATDAVQAIINRLPSEMQAYLVNATTISGATYWGLLNGGVAAVLVGDCTTGNCTVTVDNLDVQLSSSSAGLFGILSGEGMPATPDAALQLITTVYPKLEGLAFAQITDVEQGMAFTATTAGMAIDPTTMQPVSAAKVVYAGVVEFNGHPFVYALVAVGEGYVSLVS